MHATLQFIHIVMNGVQIAPRQLSLDMGRSGSLEIEVLRTLTLKITSNTRNNSYKPTKGKRGFRRPQGSPNMEKYGYKRHEGDGIQLQGRRGSIS